ncbi:MAG: chemotaxis protein CheB, partial [Nitrospinota bacterium]
RDGAEGMYAMHETGSINIAQDEASSVVFGMPNEDQKRGGVDHVLSLEKIASAIINLVSQKNN